MPNLCDLTISNGWLYPPCLEAIANLSNLTTLSIRPGGYGDFDSEQEIDTDSESIEFSTDAFPALSKLSIRRLPASEIIRVLEVKSMLRGITTLDLQFGLANHGFSTEDPQTIILKLFKALGSLPRLQMLIIRIRPSSEVKGPIDILEHLPSLGNPTLVKFLHLRGMRIDPDWPFELGLESLWQNVEALIMPTQTASVRELSLFATMPKLRYLEVDLNFEQPYIPERLNRGHSLTMCLMGTGAICLSKDFERLALIARYGVSVTIFSASTYIDMVQSTTFSLAEHPICIMVRRR
jgi:hypothetical protein